MFLMRCPLVLTAGLLLVSCANQENGSDGDVPACINEAEAEEHPGFSFQGEYSGMTRLEYGGERVEAGLQIAVYGENRFRALLHPGGLPGEHIGPEGTGVLERAIELEGSYEDYTLHLDAVDYPISVRKIHDHFTVLDEDFNYLGHLNPIQRSSTTSGMEAPDNAVQLFSGFEADLAEHWDEDSEMDGNLLKQGARTAEKYGDMRLHLEAKLGFLPDESSDRRTNSGIYIQRKYEIQIIDSFGTVPHPGSNASLYDEYAPVFDSSFPPLSWQTYDVYFRAPRFDDQGNKTENARATVYLNGLLVVDDGELEEGTGGAASYEETPEDLIYLQRHTGPVRFRNIWLAEEEYSPPGASRLVPETLPPQRR
ncbi:MAG: DUF1080 domain-containing protein [Balneolaceae bacterium]